MFSKNKKSKKDNAPTDQADDTESDTVEVIIE
jgi:hypothetical protein